MEIDHLKSSAATEDHHMEMMMMIDKYPDFYAGIYHHDLPITQEFNGGAGATTNFVDVVHPPTVSSSTSPSFNINNTQHQPYNNNSSNSTTVSFSCTTTNNNQVIQEPYWRVNNNNINTDSYSTASQKRNSMAAMRETIFRIAAMQPIQIDPESVKPPKRRNVKISKDPQSVAARHRRERISERIRILQRLVPGGTKMDTASMLDEAIHYVKFLKTQVQSLERVAATRPSGIGFPALLHGSFNNNLPMAKLGYQSGQHYADDLH